GEPGSDRVARSDGAALPGFPARPRVRRRVQHARRIADRRRIEPRIARRAGGSAGAAPAPPASDVRALLYGARAKPLAIGAARGRRTRATGASGPADSG